jgi:tetratricopeptide (TPR) repeat protein
MSTRAALPLVALLLVACAGSDEVDCDMEGAAHVSSGVVPNPAVARALAASLEPAGGGALEDGLVRRRVAALAAEVAAAAGVRGCDLTVLDTTQVVARALPGKHLQVSRGLLVVCAGDGAGDRVSALLAHLAGHVAIDPSAGVRLPADVARVDSSSRLAAIVEGTADAAVHAAPLARVARQLGAPGAPSATCDEADERALRALEELGLPAPASALEAAYAALAAAEERDPTAVAPFVAAHGSLLGRLRAAREAPPLVEPRPAAREPLDLSPLVAEVEDAATLDAADLLTRGGAADAALRLIGERRGARAATLRGLAFSALGRDREAERAWRAALLLDPASHRARVALGALYVRQGLRDAARAELDIALRRSPLDAEVHLLLGLSADEDDVARARYELARALAGDGAINRRAAEALTPRPTVAPTPPDPRRARILSGSGGGD